MKKIIIVLMILLPITGISQGNSNTSSKYINLTLIKKIEALTPKKIRVKQTKYLRINYKKSNDIISIKAYRKSLNDKLRREKLC